MIIEEGNNFEARKFLLRSSLHNYGNWGGKWREQACLAIYVLLKQFAT